jgi:hypothetical protein
MAKTPKLGKMVNKAKEVMDSPMGRAFTASQRGYGKTANKKKK